MNKELIFVYNADTGLFSLVSDFAHKILSPTTYACNLCKLTYGAFDMKKEWKDFLQNLPYKKEFLHKDEFQKKFPKVDEIKLPAIFIQEEGALRTFLNADEINAQDSLSGLKNIFEMKLKEL